MSLISLFRKKKFVSTGSLSRMVWRRFKKNKPAFFSLFFIVFATLIAVLGYLISPDSTPFANDQHLELTTKKPGTKVEMLLVRKNEAAFKQNIFSTMIWGRKSDFITVPINSYHFDGSNIIVESFTDALGEKGEEISYNMADVAYALPDRKAVKAEGDQLVFTDVEGGSHRESFAALREKIEKENIISKRFLLGTDRYGRDMLSQLLIGTRVSLSVGFISVIISLLIGLLLGSLSGFFRGWVDNLIMWFINVVWSIPTLLLVIAITFALGKGFWQVFIAVGLTMWVDVARVVRGQILSIREKEFVEAGRALGFTNSRIIIRHILPNVMGAVIVISAANFASAILLEAGLSFLGIGVQPPMPSWGTMIKEHYGYIILDSAYLAILPGLAIMLMVLAFMLVGNGLRDAMDSKG